MIYLVLQIEQNNLQVHNHPRRKSCKSEMQSRFSIIGAFELTHGQIDNVKMERENKGERSATCPGKNNIESQRK